MIFPLLFVSLNVLLQIISPLLIISGAMFAVGERLWHSFEKRMDSGDEKLLQQMSLLSDQRESDRREFHALIESLVSDVANLKLDMREHKGKVDALSTFMRQTPQL